MTNACTPERLHYLLIRYVADTGHAPNSAEIAGFANLSEEETVRVLRLLEAMHGVTLAPGSLKLWGLHPFAFNPTAFWVASGRGGWWANCAWCSLAIGAALREDVTISTSSGAEGRPLELRIENGRPKRRDVVMHFPYPPARWWDNPYCPCGNILFFSSEAEIDGWCVRHGHPKGSVLDVETGMALTDQWFGDYASPEWRRKTPEQAMAIFARLGLDSGFWSIPASFR